MDPDHGSLSRSVGILAAERAMPPWIPAGMRNVPLLLGNPVNSHERLQFLPELPLERRILVRPRNNSVSQGVLDKAVVSRKRPEFLILSPGEVLDVGRCSWEWGRGFPEKNRLGTHRGTKGA
uniref:Uncharacterized protein n=1 Tax=Lygus hesperus TaxID=30085 RepID=A0A146M432_LYGHE